MDFHGGSLLTNFFLRLLYAIIMVASSFAICSLARIVYKVVYSSTKSVPLHVRILLSAEIYKSIFTTN